MMVKPAFGKSPDAHKKTKKPPACEQTDGKKGKTNSGNNYFAAAVRALRMIDFTVSEGFAPVPSHLSAAARSIS